MCLLPQQLVWNICGVTVITVWTIVWSILIFGTLKKFKLLRVDEESELKGVSFSCCFTNRILLRSNKNKNCYFGGNRMWQFTIVFMLLLTGLDYIKHGEVAYPNKAQGDGWYNRRPRYSMDLTSSPRPSFDLTAKRPINAISEEDEGEQFFYASKPGLNQNVTFYFG